MATVHCTVSLPSRPLLRPLTLTPPPLRWLSLMLLRLLRPFAAAAAAARLADDGPGPAAAASLPDNGCR